MYTYRLQKLINPTLPKSMATSGIGKVEQLLWSPPDYSCVHYINICFCWQARTLAVCR